MDINTISLFFSVFFSTDINSRAYSKASPTMFLEFRPLTCEKIRKCRSPIILKCETGFLKCETVFLKCETGF